MAGLRGNVRVPANGRPRERRNSANLASSVLFINPNSAIQMDSLGRLELKIATNEPFSQSSAGLALTIGDGLDKAGGTLTVDLAATPGLEFSTGDLRILLDPTEPGLQLTSGLKVLLPASSGLELSSGLKIDLDTAGEDLLELNVAGLNVNEGELYSFVSYYGS